MQQRKGGDLLINDSALKAILVKNGKNVDWLAAQMGYSSTNLYNKLRGHTNITLNEVNKIREILGMSDEETKEIFFN